MKKETSPLFKVLHGVFLLLVAVVAGLAVLRACQLGWFERKQPAESDIASESEESKALLELDGKFRLISVMTLSGSFYEDASNDPVEKVLTVLLQYSGEKAVRSAELVLNGCYHFVLSAVLPGDSIYVLEQNRSVYPQGMTIASAELCSVEYYEELPGLMEEQLSILVNGKSLTVQNRSDSEMFPGGTLVYKNEYEGCLLGGISYTLELPPLIPGQSAELTAERCRGSGSRLMFILPAD